MSWENVVYAEVKTHAVELSLRALYNRHVTEITMGPWHHTLLTLTNWIMPNTKHVQKHLYQFKNISVLLFLICYEAV